MKGRNFSARVVFSCFVSSAWAIKFELLTRVSRKTAGNSRSVIFSHNHFIAAARFLDVLRVSAKCTYLLPILRRTCSEVETGKLAHYFQVLTHAGCEVLVIDGSPPAMFNGHAAIWSRKGRHLRVDPPVTGFALCNCWFAPLWLTERGVSTYFAFRWYLFRGAYPFGRRILSKAVGRDWFARGEVMQSGPPLATRQVFSGWAGGSRAAGRGFWQNRLKPIRDLNVT